MLRSPTPELSRSALESFQLSTLRADPSCMGTICPFPVLLERIDPYAELLPQPVRNQKISPEAYFTSFPKKSPRSTREEDQQRSIAARQIQAFFRRIARQSRRKQLALQQRIRAIEEEKQRELTRIAQWKEHQMRDALQLLQEEQHNESQCLEATLQDVRQVIEEVTQELMVFKKENAFLFKRCLELKKSNDDLGKESREQKEQLRCLKRHSLKLKSVLCRYQFQLGEARLQLRDQTQQWHACKESNQQVRSCMRRIVQLVEEKEPEHCDKLDLIDELYEIQRGTQWKRNVYKARVTCEARRNPRPTKSYKAPTQRDQIPHPASKIARSHSIN